VSRGREALTIRTTPLVLALGVLTVVALPAMAQDSLIQRPLITRLAFRGNRGLDSYVLATSIATTNSSWWVRTAFVSWIGLGQRRYFDQREFRRDVLRLKLLYAQAGYPDATIDTTVVRHYGRDSISVRSVDLTFHIVEGRPLRVTELRVNSADIDHLLSMDEVYGERVTSRIIAIVATSDSTFGMARMYEMRSDRDGRVSVFRNEAEARAWLGNGVAGAAAAVSPSTAAAR